MSSRGDFTHSLQQVKKDSELHGLTAALEALTASVEEEFRSELLRFEKKWDSIDSKKATEELFATRCSEFLEKLGRIRGKDNPSSNVVTSLYHPSFQADFSSIFRRAGLSGNPRTLPSPTAGKLLVDLSVSLYLLESKWVDDKSIGAYSNACRFLGSHALTERFWVDNDLGTPLVGRGFTEEKGLLDKAYKKLVHAIFLNEGFVAARNFVIDSLKPAAFLEIFSEEIEFGDVKTLLQEYAQEQGMKPPAYQFKRDPNSSDHDPTFEIKISLPKIGEISINAKSKKDGSKKLAEVAIIQLKRHSHSRDLLMRLLSKKSAAFRKERKPVSTQFIPNEVFDLAAKVKDEFGMEPDLYRLLQSVKTKSKGRSALNFIPDNDVMSLIGALALDFAIISSDAEFRSLGIEGVHPRICDLIVDHLELKRVSRSIYQPIHDWGINADRQMAQALLFSLLINDQIEFFRKICAWIKTKDAFRETVERSISDRNIPEVFDEKFSYATVLQEFVQKASTVLPEYSKITLGPTHAATHTAFCRYDSITTKGTSSRFVWAKNAAAFEMLKEIGFWQAPQ
jgi:dsRNA-specific ribonuclease